MKVYITVVIITLIVLIAMVGAMATCNAQSQVVTYVIESDQPQAPTLITYWHGGNEIYDSLNWGNSDGDTMPWRLTIGANTSPRVRAQYYGSTQPVPTYTCSIDTNGVVLIESTSEGYAECSVRQL